MTHKRLAKGLTLLFFAAATSFAACGGEDPLTTEQKYCNQRCDCNGCTDSERATCVDDKINLKDESESDCGEEYSTLLRCLTNDAACADGDYDESMCFAEESDLNSCLNPPPACNLVNNGVCNEPPPKGDGLCVAGSDTMDCSVPTCPSAGDGICDEPEGTGLCAEGSDPLDCGLSCPTENNGVCDEPGGTGTCAAGTDPTDCYCAYTSDGYCDEPEGSGLCPEGSDSVDCGGGGACVRCAEYYPGSSATLCPESQSLWNAFNTCACGTCAAVCSANFCAGGDGSTDCINCIDTTCSSQLSACSNDF
ncbi:hypothetical protein [Polyangium spumosum]|uniref:Uncharacterized protein n=1 Tax=Polyangium spumosum TaxID=889282 RepID=A0A6N7PWZ9_9BACT|nr:hypothetical protein [Polyangium spumosum]MRG93341.1 hypothetical protein [Polyangium spumosum]